MPEPDPAAQLMDATWLADNAAAFGTGTLGPYVYGLAFTNAGRSYPVPASMVNPGRKPYRLAVDVAREGIAFLAAGANCDFDIAGHTITYNDGEPTPVPGGDFADWPGAWDTSGAAASTFTTVDSAPLYMPGPKTLQWTVPAGAAPQSILSAPIVLADVLHTYTATVCSHPGTSGFGLRIEPLDSGTLAPVARWRRNEENAVGIDGGICSFLPDRPGQTIRLRVTNLPGPGGTVGPIGRVVVTRSHDYGVVATPVYRTEFGGFPFYMLSSDPTNIVYGWYNLGPKLQQAYAPGGGAPAIFDSVGGGAIVQGRAAGAYSHAIFAPSTRGALRVEGVECRVAGDDTSGIVISNPYVATAVPGDSRTVRNCRVTYPEAGSHITVRGAIVAAIEAQGGGPMLIEGCTISDNPQSGIKLGTIAAGATAVARGNTLTPQTVITNGYALMIRGSHVRLLDNRVIAAKSSRGIHVEGTCQDIEIAGNTIDVRERGNREYHLDAGCRALAIRNLGNINPATNVSIHDNTFIARTGLGLQHEADAARFVFNNLDTDGANIVLRDNVFRGLIEGDADPGKLYRASGVLVDKCVPAVRPRWERCRVEGTDVAVQLSGPNAGSYDQASDLTFAGCTLAKPTEGLQTRPFSAWQVGWNYGPVTRIMLLGTSYANGATPAILWGGGPGERDVEVGWTLTVRARDGAGAAVPGATATLVDAAGTARSGTTGADGSVELPAPVTRYYRPGTKVIVVPTASPLGPHRLTVARSDLPLSPLGPVELTLTADTTYLAALGGDGGGPVPAPGAVAFAAASYTASVLGATAISVVRTGGSSGPVSVAYATTGGTAAPGVDFVPAAGTLAFGDGELTRSFSVTVLALPAADVTVGLTLSAPAGGASLGTPAAATLTLTGTPPPPPPPPPPAGPLTLVLVTVGGNAIVLSNAGGG